MILTIPANAMPDDLAKAVSNLTDIVSAKLYDLKVNAPGQPPVGNVYLAVTWCKGRRLSFTLRTRFSHKYGSRTSARGRHMPKASWQAHRDVMRAIFDVWPEARLISMYAIYEGKAEFERDFPASYHYNVGSTRYPRVLGNCEV